MSAAVLKGLRSKFLLTKGYHFAPIPSVVAPQRGLLTVSVRRVGSLEVSVR